MIPLFGLRCLENVANQISDGGARLLSNRLVVIDDADSPNSWLCSKMPRKNMSWLYVVHVR